MIILKLLKIIYLKLFNMDIYYSKFFVDSKIAKLLF